MSIARCPYCDEMYDQDYDVEHEEMCKQEHEEDKKEMNEKAIKNLNKLQDIFLYK